MKLEWYEYQLRGEPHAVDGMREYAVRGVLLLLLSVITKVIRIIYSNIFV